MGSGSGDSLADAWEIDEPGYLFGDIYTNLLNGSLDNSNIFDPSFTDDVSLALGFDVGSLLAFETIVASFEISTTQGNGLYHYDPASNSGFYFSASLTKAPVNISLPSTLALFGVGILAIRLRRRKFRL